MSTAIKCLPYFTGHLLAILAVSNLFLGDGQFGRAAVLILVFGAIFDHVAGGRRSWLLFGSDVHVERNTHAFIAISSAFVLLVCILLSMYFIYLSNGVIFDAKLLLCSSLIGSLSVATGHELVHSQRLFDRLVGIILMTVCGCPLFVIEHYSGHHKNIGKAVDPATAGYGVSFFQYFPEYVTRCVLDSYELAKVKRSHGRKRSWGLAAPGFLLLLCCMLLGWVIALFLVGVNGAGFLVGIAASSNVFLALANYIQHYGLSRRQKGGRWEPIGPSHSWDSYHPFSNWLLLNLPLHSEHHVGFRRQLAGPLPGLCSPVLPSGYLVMIWLPIIPQLWMRVMHRTIGYYWAKLESDGDFSHEGM
ncbi:Alkane 1-monooxygenase 2 [Ensifer psoraleae]|uniref:fatty acid desaturase n=1 Tax=Sinorhizobium psoraleae TaxID=520838 RepID=UPI001567FF21|nr:fatty acid desaturase [Sinorhizobium psoraleae]NRP73912.1 Alkane 1-monooxygenase 2 [Sinorhizobium psoraleae]